MKSTAKSVRVSRVSPRLAVGAVAVELVALLGYVAFEYGWAKVPEFLAYSALTLLVAVVLFFVGLT